MPDADAGGHRSLHRHQPADRIEPLARVGRELRFAMLNGLTIAVLIGAGVSLVPGSAVSAR